eukprot:1228359-Prymnesium_polylepis.1
MAITSWLEMTGHASAILDASPRSKPSTSGALTAAHAEKCERLSTALCSGMRPTSSMSGYAQHPGRLSGRPLSARVSRKGATLIRLDITRSHRLTMSPLVRNILYGHQPGPIWPGLPPSVMFRPWWQFSIMTAWPLALNNEPSDAQGSEHRWFGFNGCGYDSRGSSLGSVQSVMFFCAPHESILTSSNPHATVDRTSPS